MFSLILKPTIISNVGFYLNMLPVCNIPCNVVIGDVLRSANTKYLVQSFVGQGTFGLVAKCRNLATNANVAIKIIRNICKLKEQTANEISALRKLQQLDSNKSNIVHWYEHFNDRGNSCLVFEQLDKSLQTFMVERNWKPLPIKEIRPIVQQVARALSDMKALRLLHGDIKLHNIMLVNQQLEPLRIKVIDFGLAYDVSATRPGHIFQTVPYRSPEVFLGLPLTTAMDIWSLGCMAAVLFLGALLFEGKTDYDIVMQIVQIMGLPPDQLLSTGLMTTCYFEKTFDSSITAWKVKTLAQYYKDTGEMARDLRKHRIRSLDDLLKVHQFIHRLSPDDLAEMNDVFMFVDMLKLMLHIDATQRVTSHRLLEHQFITMSHIMPFYNLSPYSRSCHEIMMVSQIHSSRDAEWQSSQQVNISSAQPKYDVCPSPLLHPAVMTGQAQLAGHDWDTTVHSKKGSKSKAGDCNSIYELKLKPSGGSPARETHAGPLMSTSIKPHPEARSHMRIRSVHPSGDPQPQVLCWNTNISQGKRPPFEHTSNDGSSKQLFVKRKTCDDHEIGSRDAKNPKLQHQ